MSSRNNKYRLQIFKQLKRGNYIITPFNVYKNVNFSSNTYLDQYKFLNDITIIKNTAPLGCEDFYSQGLDCNLINNGEGVLINWIYGQSRLQNKGTYTIILTKSNTGVCNCLFLGLSTDTNTTRNRPYLFTISTGTFLNRTLYPLGKIPIGTKIYSSSFSQSIDSHILYDSVNHCYYKSNFDEIDYNLGYYINKSTVRNLYESCSVLNVRQDLFGNSIKRNSFNVYDYSLSGSYTSSVLIKDDGKSNLYVNTIDTSSFVNTNNLLLHLSFDEKFKDKIENKKTYFPIKDHSIYENNGITISGSYYTEGFTTTGIKEESVGTALLCDGAPVYVQHGDHLQFVESNDFSISFFVSASISAQNSQVSQSFIFAKQDFSLNFIKNKYNKSIDYKLLKTLSGVYPFSVRYINTGSDSGKIYFSRYGGSDEAFITSSIPVSESYYHVVCQKTGSNFELYINGQLDSSGSCLVNGSVYNNSPIFIGSLLETQSAFFGKLDEIRLYNRALLPSEIESLSNVDYINTQALQTNKIGNIFYNTGAVVISTQLPAYKNMLLGLSGSRVYEDVDGNYYGFDGQFKSTKKIFQHEIIIPIRSYEYNFSSNPTLKKDNLSNSYEFKPFVSSSAFNVYFTSIGLYNRNYELVAVAKLNTPIPKYQDKDLNIIVKFDVE
jgi:hypothetical protein